MERERREEDYSNIKSLVGFHPLSFVDDVINSTNDYCCDSVEELANFLRGHKTIGKKYKQEIEQGSKDLLQRLQGAFAPNLDKFELFCLNVIFSLPQNTKAETTGASGPKKKKQKKETSSLEQAETKLDEEVQELRLQAEERIAAAEQAHTHLQQVQQENAVLQAQLEKLSVVPHTLKKQSIVSLEAEIKTLQQQTQQMLHALSSLE